MLGPLVAIFFSVALGCLLALAPQGSRVLGGLVRTFAVGAALGVVLIHLVPHALEQLGAVALGVVAAAYLSVPLAESGAARLVRRLGRAGVDLRLEAAYAALLVHRLGDGAAMAAGQRHGLSLVVAIAAHEVPVAAFVVLAFSGTRGLRHGLGRAVGLGVASIVGVLLVNAAPGLLAGLASAYVDAIVAGTLVHVVAHELRTDPPEAVLVKLADFGVVALGVATSLVPALVGDAGHAHGGHAGEGAGTEGAAIFQQALALGLAVAPALLLGLILAALLHSLARGFPLGWRAVRGIAPSALRGSVLAAPLPLCSCGVVPISRALGAAGATPALVGAFLVATPELGLDTLLVTAALLGWPFALGRAAGAVLVALGVGLLAGLLARRALPAPAGDASALSALAHVQPELPFAGRFLRALDELMVHVGVWMLVGVIVAAYVECLIPHEAMSSFRGSWYELALVTVVALPLTACAPAATPVIAILALSPGAALAALLLGSTLDPARLRLIAEVHGWRVAVGVASGLVGLVWVLAWAANAAGLTAHLAPAAAPGPLAWLALAALAVLVLRTSFSVGVRAWLANVFAPHHEGHAHIHVHAHCDHDAAESHAWDQWHDHDAEAQGGAPEHPRGHAPGHGHAHDEPGH